MRNKSQASSGRVAKSTAKSKKASALAATKSVDTGDGTSENGIGETKEAGQNGPKADLDGPTLIVSDDDKSHDLKQLEAKTIGLDVSHDGSINQKDADQVEVQKVLELGKESAVRSDTQLSSKARPSSRGSQPPGTQAEDMALSSKPESSLGLANDSPKTLIQLQEYAIYSVELLQRHGSEIDRLSEAVDKIGNIQDDLRSSIIDTRQRLNRLERRSARAISPEATVDPEEIEVLATSISQINNRINEVDSFKLALDLFKSRVKRLEAGHSRHALESSIDRSPSPAIVTRELSDQIEDEGDQESTTLRNQKRKRERIVSEIEDDDEKEEYASMIEDMRQKRLPKTKHASFRRDHVSKTSPRYSSQRAGPHSPSRASTNDYLDRASSLPSKLLRSQLRSQPSSLMSKKPRPTGPVRIPGRPGQRPDPDIPQLGIEEEDTWDPLADNDDDNSKDDIVDSEPRFRAFPAKVRGDSIGALRDIRLKNMASKLHKTKNTSNGTNTTNLINSTHIEDDSAEAMESNEARKRSSVVPIPRHSHDREASQGDEPDRLRKDSVPVNAPTSTSNSDVRRRPNQSNGDLELDSKEQERTRREDRDREASVAMGLNGVDDL